VTKKHELKVTDEYGRRKDDVVRKKSEVSNYILSRRDIRYCNDEFDRAAPS